MLVGKCFSFVLSCCVVCVLALVFITKFFYSFMSSKIIINAFLRKWLPHGSCLINWSCIPHTISLIGSCIPMCFISQFSMGIWHIDTSLSIVHVILIKMNHTELDFLFNMFVVCSFLLELKEMGWNLMLPNVWKNHPYQQGIKQHCGYIHKTLNTLRHTSGDSKQHPTMHANIHLTLDKMLSLYVLEQGI